MRRQVGSYEAHQELLKLAAANKTLQIKYMLLFARYLCHPNATEWRQATARMESRRALRTETVATCLSCASYTSAELRPLRLHSSYPSWKCVSTMKTVHKRSWSWGRLTQRRNTGSEKHDAFVGSSEIALPRGAAENYEAFPNWRCNKSSQQCPSEHCLMSS